MLESPARLCSRARMLTLFLRMSLLLAVSRVTRPDSVAASRSLGQSSADTLRLYLQSTQSPIRELILPAGPHQLPHHPLHHGALPRPLGVGVAVTSAAGQQLEPRPVVAGHLNNDSHKYQMPCNAMSGVTLSWLPPAPPMKWTHSRCSWSLALLPPPPSLVIVGMKN